MRILMTADTVGGVWTYALELAHALVPHGVTVALATMGLPPKPDQRAEAERVPGLEFYPSEYSLEWMNDPWEDVERAGEWLMDLESRFQPDLIHLNGYAHGVLPWKAPVLVVGHSCVLSWGRALDKGEVPEKYHRYRDAVTAGLRAADLVLAPTTAMLEELRTLYGPLPPTRVVPNGRSPALFPPGEKDSLVLAAGRLWDEAKNVTTLAKAAEGLPWPVYLAGELQGGPTDYGEANLLGRLTQHDLAGWLSRASIYAFPARYEPFGLSVLEAAFARCALVLGDIPSLREVWGDAALFVPPTDREALQEAILSLIDDRDRRKHLAERARERAFLYTPERMAAGYLTAYRYLLEQERSVAQAPRTEEERAPCVS